MKKLDTVAFDLGGVLAYQDFSYLTEEELFLFKTYMNRFKNPVSEELLRYAKSKMNDIFVKMYKLNKDAILTLEILLDREIRPSIWTNSVEEINAWFESINLYRYIKGEDIINSFYLNVDKPDMRFYKKALEILSINPQDVLFYDDNNLNVAKARECGIWSEEYQLSDNLKDVVLKDLGRMK